MKALKKSVSVLLLFQIIFCPTVLKAQTSRSPVIDPSLQDNGPEAGGSFRKLEKKDKKEPLPTDGRGPELLLPSFGTLTYQVHVLGEVANPGTYRLPASTRLSEAIGQAGGLLERGSERRIELRRRGGEGRVVDLLSFKVLGNLDANPYLLDNDVVFVPLKKNVVQIEGAVRRPGTYEIKTENSLENLVRLVGGFSPGAGNVFPIKVVRFEGGRKEILDVENTKDGRHRFKLRNADVVVVSHIFTGDKKFDYNLARLPGDNPLFYPSYEERVFVLGAVAKPGPYSFSPYFGVRQYLTLAGGTTKLAKVKKIVVIHSDGTTRKVGKDKVEMNPGDTIVVPEKYMAPENVVSLVLGITTSILGITTTILTLTR